MKLFDHSKPGGGVEKDLHESKIRIFFGVIQRKFWQMILLNLLYCFCSIPLLAVYFIIIYNNSADISYAYVISIASLLHLSTVGIGFIMPGFTYVLRNYARQQHAYTFFDFFSNIKRNFKQGFLLFLTDTVVTYILYLTLGTYFLVEDPDIFVYFARTFIIILGSVYYIMHFYIYQIMVTLKMSFLKILKNSFILTLAHLPQNLMILVIITAVAMLTFSASIIAGGLFSVLISTSLMGYIVNFIVHYVIDRYIVE